MACILVAWVLISTASWAALAEAATDAPATIAGEWLSGFGRLTFEHRGGEDYHAIYEVVYERIPGRVSFELEGSLVGTVFDVHWICHFIKNNAIEPCRSKRN